MAAARPAAPRQRHETCAGRRASGGGHLTRSVDVHRIYVPQRTGLRNPFVNELAGAWGRPSKCRTGSKVTRPETGLERRSAGSYGGILRISSQFATHKDLEVLDARFNVLGSVAIFRSVGGEAHCLFEHRLLKGRGYFNRSGRADYPQSDPDSNNRLAPLERRPPQVVCAVRVKIVAGRHSTMGGIEALDLVEVIGVRATPQLPFLVLNVSLSGCSPLSPANERVDDARKRSDHSN